MKHIDTQIKCCTAKRERVRERKSKMKEDFLLNSSIFKSHGPQNNSRNNNFLFILFF